METSLLHAHLGSSDLSGAFLDNADLRGASLNDCLMDVKTSLIAIMIDRETELADIVLDGVPLTRVDWQQAPVIGDETEARNANDSQGKKNSAYLRLVYYQRAARAYRQLAVALRSQGLSEAADRYAYRGHLMQREVLWRQAIAPQNSTLSA